MMFLKFLSEKLSNQYVILKEICIKRLKVQKVPLVINIQQKPYNYKKSSVILQISSEKLVKK